MNNSGFVKYKKNNFRSISSSQNVTIRRNSNYQINAGKKVHGGYHLKSKILKKFGLR